MSAFSRAISVDTCSGDGSGRVMSEYCRTRAGVGSTATTTRSMAACGRMRLEIEQRERAQRARVAHRRRQLQRPLVRGLRHEVQPHVEHRRAAIAAFEVGRQRLDEAAEHERQRLEPFDRPLEIERLLEAFLGHRGHERRGVFAAREPLPLHAGLAEARGHVGGRQRRHLAERAQAPAAERGDEFGRFGRV